MSHPSFPIELKPEHSHNAGFFQWVKSNSAFFVSQIAAILSIILYIGTFFYYVVGHDTSHKAGYIEYLQEAKHLIFLLNICFALIFVIASLYISTKKEEGKQHVKLFHQLVFKVPINHKVLSTAEEKLKTFKIVMLYYWVYVLLYYIFLLLIKESHDEKAAVKIYADTRYWIYFVGNIMVVILYVCFCKMILSNKFKYEYYTNAKGILKQKKPFRLTFSMAIIIFLVLNILPFLYYVPLIKNYTPVLDEWFQFMDLTSGIVKMVILALLFSRFDSKLIGLPSSLIIVLYIYAIIQPLDVALNGKDIISQSMAVTNYALAFILKLYFFLILTYAMQTGRMLNFFCCNGEMTQRLNESRAATETAAGEGDNRNYTRILFLHWLRSKGWLRIIILGGIFIATFFIAFIRDSKSHKVSWIEVLTIICSLSLFFFLRKQKIGQLCDTLRPLKKSFFYDQQNKLFGEHLSLDERAESNLTPADTIADKDFEHAIKLYRKFLEQFALLFLSYGLLFTVLVADDLFCENKELSQVFKIITFSLNNLGCWFLFKCFARLFMPTKRTNPKRVFYHLRNFSAFVLVALTVIYIISVYGPEGKQLFNSGEIGISKAKKDTLIVYDEPIKVHDSLYPKALPATGRAVTVASQVKWAKDQRAGADTGLQGASNKVQTAIIDSPFVLNGMVSLREKPALIDSVVKLKALMNTQLLTGRSKNDSTLMLALQLSPELKNRCIHLPGYMVANGEINGKAGEQIRNIVINIDNDADKVYDNIIGDTLKLHVKALNNNDILYTGLYVTFDTGSISDGEVLDFPEQVVLYTEKPKFVINKLFDIISGLLNALVFALVIGRLDSRFVGINKKWIVLLFLYPAIQPLYIYIVGNSTLITFLKPMVISAALLLKIYLFLMVYYIAQSGRLLTYFFCLRKLDEKSDAVYNNHYEIIIRKDDHHNAYLCTVQKEHVKLLQCDYGFKTMDESKDFIRTLQQNLQEEAITIDKNKLGHDWLIEIKSTGKEFYSKDYSEDDATELQEDLKEKLKYSKLSIAV